MLSSTDLELQWRNSSLGSTKEIQEETELCGFKVKAGGTNAIVPVLSPPHMQPVGRHHFSWVEPISHAAKCESTLAFWILQAPPWWHPKAPHNPTRTSPEALSAGQSTGACTAVFLGQLLGVCRPQVVSGWPCVLCLFLSGPRLSTGTKSESALTRQTALTLPR